MHHRPVKFYELLLSDIYATLPWVRTSELCYVAPYDRIVFHVSLEGPEPTVRVEDKQERTACCIRGRIPNRVLKYLRYNVGP